MDGYRSGAREDRLKTEVFGELDRLAEPDAILCSNSSSIPTGQMIGKVEHPERVLNTHYQQPPELNAVELMSSGDFPFGLGAFDGDVETPRIRMPLTSCIFEERCRRRGPRARRSPGERFVEVSRTRADDQREQPRAVRRQAETW